jgi:coenzyme PQQ precursor peptide PqqA
VSRHAPHGDTGHRKITQQFKHNYNLELWNQNCFSSDGDRTHRRQKDQEAETVFGRRPPTTRKSTMKWTTPSFEDLRLGFEINLYINNR